MEFQNVDLPLLPSPYEMIMASRFTMPMAPMPVICCT